MKFQKINISFLQYSDANLQTKSENIYISMFNNPSFPVTVPTVADLKTAVDVYAAALYAATNRSRDNIALKNQARIALEAILMQLGNCVMNVANGDVTMLISSGYSLSKMPTPNHIANPGVAKLSAGINPGELVALIPRVDGAMGYLFDIAPDAATLIWKSTPGTRSKFLFTGLEAGKKYWVRVAAMGAGGQVTYGTSVCSQFVQ